MDIINKLNLLIKILAEIKDSKGLTGSKLGGKDLLDNKDVMVLFQNSERNLRRWRAEGVLTYLLIAGSLYYRWEDILPLLQRKYPEGE